MPFKLSTPKTLVGAAIALTALSGHAVTLVGITTQNQVAVFDTTNIAGATFTAITGLAVGEQFVGIDLRPGNNTIYGVSTANKLYTLNAFTGVATAGPALSANVISASPSVGYGIDFNPSADFTGATSLRFSTSTGGNFAINATTGAVTVASTTAPGFSNVSYSNSTPLPTAAPAPTSLFYIDSINDTLSVAATGFNNPAITFRGNLGVDALKAGGFEVLADGSAFAALNIDGGLGTTGIYSINLATGAATSLGTFGGTLNGLTVAAIPEPETYALLLAGLGMVGFMAKRRKSV